MNTIVISDLHLTNIFDPKKYAYLQKVIKPSDRVVINGDFWDGYLISFKQFVDSRWRYLFSLLKSKKTIYVYGNHDQEKMASAKVKLFSNYQTHRFKIYVGKTTFTIEHGNRIAPSFDQQYSSFPTNRFTISLGLAYIHLGIKLLGPDFFSSIFYPQAQICQKKLKSWSQKTMNKNQILVCGHSHIAEVDLEAKYINTGFIHLGYGSYLRIIYDKWELIRDKY